MSTWRCSVMMSVLAVTTSAEIAGSFNTNLLVNGDAETGDDTGWSPAGLVNATASSVAGTLGLPSGVSIGEFSFHGEFGDPQETVEQIVSLSALAEAIDGGDVQAEIEGLVQSRRFMGLVDSAAVNVFFLNGSGAQLLHRAYTDAVVMEGVADWTAFAETVDVPVGARTIRVTMTFSRSGGASSDGFVDNLSIILRSTTCPADVDGDGDVDFADLNLLLANFNMTGAGLPGDIDADGDVDFADLNALVSVFNTQCP